MMKKTGFIKTTLIGGLIFLIPFVVITAVLGKAVKLMISLADPISKVIPIESVAGVAIVNIVAITVLIFICFFAGLLARSKAGKRAFNSLDIKLMALIPGYAFVKGIAGSMDGKEDKKVLIPVLAKFDDQSQVGFEVERLDNGLVAVFLPGSPDTWSGTVAYMTEDRVEKLNIDFTAATKTLRTLGRGSNELFTKNIK